MTMLSKALNTLGILLLAHACYSAQEHSSYLQTTAPSSLSVTNHPSLPPDVVLETLLSVFILCLGLVLGSPPLRPISWRVWAGMIERGAVGGAAAGEETNPFLALENRVAFWDVRAKRKEFERWVKREREMGVVKS